MCSNKAYWQCNCPGCPKTCDLHVQIHSIKKKCLMRNIKALYLAAKARSNQNALNTLELDSINLANKMIKEVKNCLNENLNLISREKQRIKVLTLDNNESQVRTILNWMASINEKMKIKVLTLNKNESQVRTILNWMASINDIKRNSKAFTSSLNMLLGLDNNSIELLKEEEKQNILNEKTKEDLQISNNKIKKMEKEIANLKRENENEIANLKRENENEIANLKIENEIEIANLKRENEIEIANLKREIANLKRENEIEKNKKIVNLAKDLTETEKKLEMLNINMAATDKKLLNLNLTIQIAKEKLEEFKIVLPSSEFKDNFTCMTLEEKKKFLVNYDFENFDKDFKAGENEPLNIILTKDLKYIFVCKVQSRLEEKN
ncbi:hypothetical protein SteCoe_38339 [Stentor coeruleus]|uniref:Uncharacterized protein n=1 Tax=Stentor coeruleus TaxID=5963 RepID=A0A1R2ALU8_9CILI|nr:hypothetical protein SteCoe_38339 [Stentor coeruleus]